MNQAPSSDVMRYLLLGVASYLAARTKSPLLKWSLIGSLAFVVYQDVKANKGQLAGNPGRWGVNVDYAGMVDTVFPNLGSQHSTMIATALGSLFERMTRS